MTPLTNMIEIPRWVARDFQFKGNQLLIYSLFYQFKSKPLSVSQVAETVCQTRKNVDSTIRVLRDKGYLKTFFKDNKVNWYMVNMDFIPEQYR